MTPTMLRIMAMPMAAAMSISARRTLQPRTKRAIATTLMCRGQPPNGISVMIHNSHINASANVRTLVASPRNVELHVCNCMLYEFEDVLREIEEVDLLCPQSSFENNLAYFI